MKPAGIESKLLRDLSQEHARILIIALENMIYSFGSDPCGELYYQLCLDLFTDDKDKQWIKIR